MIDTFELAEQCGINTVLINPTCQEIVTRYNKERGGRMQTIVAIKPEADPARTKEILSAVVDAGADTAYTHGEITDRFVREGNLEPVAQALDLIRAAGLPAGTAATASKRPRHPRSRASIRTTTSRPSTPASTGRPRRKRTARSGAGTRSGPATTTTTSTTCTASIPRRRPPSWRRSRSRGSPSR